MASVLLWIGAAGFGFLAVVLPAAEEAASNEAYDEVSPWPFFVGLALLVVALLMAHFA